MTSVTRVQKDTGTTIKPGPMLEASPEQVVTDALTLRTQGEIKPKQ